MRLGIIERFACDILYCHIPTQLGGDKINHFIYLFRTPHETKKTIKYITTIFLIPSTAADGICPKSWPLDQKSLTKHARYSPQVDQTFLHWIGGYVHIWDLQHLCLHKCYQHVLLRYNFLKTVFQEYTLMIMVMIMVMIMAKMQNWQATGPVLDEY